MPATKKAIKTAIDEGVTSVSLGARRVVGDRKSVKEIELVRCLSVFDKTGKFKPSFEERNNQINGNRHVIFAIGENTDLSILPREIKTDNNISLLTR